MGAESKDDAVRQIQKLMRTADSNATEGEIRNALRFARRLMDKWNVEEVDLDDKERQATTKIVVLVAGSRQGSLEVIDRNLCGTASVICDVEVIFSKTRDGREHLKFVGYERDAQIAVTIWNQLRLQMRVLARHRCGKRWSPTHADYCKGFASTLYVRANEIKRASVHAAGRNCKAIVLRKSSAVADFMHAKYPRIKARRGGQQKFSNTAAFMVGGADAQAVELGEKRHADDRALEETKQLK